MPSRPPLHALTLYASWAHAICVGSKRVENREWEPPRWLIGEWLALHAGKTLDEAGLDELRRIDQLVLEPEDVPLGAIVALVRVAGVVRIHVAGQARETDDPWEDLRAVKNLWLGRDADAVQWLPPETEYVNVHEHCLHLWARADGSSVCPTSHGGAEVRL